MDSAEITPTIVDQIIEIVRTHPNAEILGAQLGSEVRAALREQHGLDSLPGGRSLREFIREHVSGVFEVRRRGQDVVYAIGPAPRDQDTKPEPPVIDVQAWKTFVSPNGPYRLFVNPEAQQFRLKSAKAASEPSPWVQLPTCPPEVHLQIAEQFAETLEPNQRTTMKEILKHERWWLELASWGRSHGVSDEWKLFRRQRLFEELEKSLQRLDLRPDILRQSEPRSRRIGQGLRRNGPRENKSLAALESPDEKLRSIAVHIVQGLSTDELRGLKLPLGEVLDAIRNAR